MAVTEIHRITTTLNKALDYIHKTQRKLTIRCLSVVMLVLQILHFISSTRLNEIQIKKTEH